MGVQFVPDAILLHQELRTQNFTPLAIWISDDAVNASAGFGTSIGKMADYRLCTEGILPNRLSSLYAKVNPRFKEMLGYDLTGDPTATYDGMRVIFDALERAGTTDGPALIEAIRKTNLKEHLFTSDLPIKFDERGQNTGIGYVLTQYHNGKVEVVYPDKYKTHDLVWPMPKWSERKW
jgi:branched-chain amino acid transport system substrate-binding protein